MEGEMKEKSSREIVVIQVKDFSHYNLVYPKFSEVVENPLQ